MGGLVSDRTPAEEFAFQTEVQTIRNAVFRDEELWSRYFAAAIASEEHHGPTAVELADIALKQHRERWPR